MFFDVFAFFLSDLLQLFFALGVVQEAHEDVLESSIFLLRKLELGSEEALNVSSGSLLDPVIILSAMLVLVDAFEVCSERSQDLLNKHISFDSSDILRIF